MSQRIHHLVPASELRAGCGDITYVPARLDEVGFVHCSAGRDVTLAVAADYFGDVDEPLFVLEIDVEKLGSELRFEAPAPIAGGGSDHLAHAETFPHVYGPIERAAITGVGELARGGDGFRWPCSFASLDEVIALD
jgi:uncharacterized protein (DUF952 family)